MRMVDVIQAKKEGRALTEAQIRFFVHGVVSGEVPDYQSAALLMAICFAGMNEEETLSLTMAMVESGDSIDLSAIPGVKVDKHSTGGVGDKTTLILAPLVAACGVPVAKMSGRGLGHTGGTIDKLESIPGFSTDLSMEDFVALVRRVGVAVAGQTGHLVPADKKLYALRDVTATIDNLSLIAASIMSKKLASGADAIVLDVKMGSGAFMRTRREAEELARMMVVIGNGAGRKTAAVLSDMDQPLGYAIGNGLEVAEALEVLSGHGPADVKEICLVLSSLMLELAGKGESGYCRAMAEEALASGAAKERFKAMVQAQGGSTEMFDSPQKISLAPIQVPFHAPRAGVIHHMISDQLGLAAMMLGAGRKTKEDTIDPVAGILLVKKPGDAVMEGDIVAMLHTSERAGIETALQIMEQAVVIGNDEWHHTPLVLGILR